MGDLFSNIRGRKQIKIKNMEFDIFCDKEEEAILDEVINFVESKFKEEEERLSRMKQDIDWATVLVNVIIDVAYRYLILKKENDKLTESVKFNIQRIDAKFGGPRNA